MPNRMRAGLLVALCALGGLPLMAAAQQLPGDIAIDVRLDGSVAADSPLTPEAVTQMVGGIVAERGYQWHPAGTDYPMGATVLRVIYIVAEQNADPGPVAAVSSSVNLIQGANMGGGKVILSLYDGVTQSISQKTDLAAARAEVREAFANELRLRIHEALQHMESLY